jgi:signal transduction histidine kinase
LVNLISNAVQAVEHQSEAKILVTLSGDNDYITLSIEDSGPGVPEEYVNKLFKPNFTTKSGGTGLGLYICRSIIEQSQGTISYRRSEKLGGACFTFALKKSE